MWCLIGELCCGSLDRESPDEGHLEELEAVGITTSGQLLSHVLLFVTPWTAALQASLSTTNSQSLLKLMSIELVMPFSHLILFRPPSPPAFSLSQNQGLFQ